jgi:hypothetical protein
MDIEVLNPRTIPGELNVDNLPSVLQELDGAMIFADKIYKEVEN